jgi:endonuclease YncB( thermonuclease family)
MPTRHFCFAVLLSLSGTVEAQIVPITSDQVRVIDGDTIRIGHQKPDIRLVGFNAPETRRAICEFERQLGGKATRRLRDLVQSSQLDFQFVPCACQPGTEGTPSCNYGRRCGTLKANGLDVGLILIRENLAVPLSADKHIVRQLPNHGASRRSAMPGFGKGCPMWNRPLFVVA